MKQVYFLLTFLFFFSFLQGQIVDIPDANFKNALVNTNCVDTDDDGTYDSDADLNNDGEIQVSEAEAVTVLMLNNRAIYSLEGIESFFNLEILRCGFNNLTSLNISNLTSLSTLYCGANDITALDVSALTNLTSLSCVANNLTSIDVSNLTNLNHLDVQNNDITSLDVSGLTNLDTLWCSGNQITGLTVVDLPNLNYLSCGFQPLETLILDNLPNLDYLQCDWAELSELDVSGLPVLSTLDCDVNQLTFLSIKNGSQLTSIDFSDNEYIEYICVDDSELEYIQGLVQSYNYFNVAINSYCSFVPGGEYFNFQGQSRFDIDNDGCDMSDNPYSYLKLNISDGTQNGTAISDSFGQYIIPVREGIYTIRPTPENPEFFIITPSEIEVDFPSDDSPFNQDFCLTSAGDYNDLEVVIIPLEVARPGINVDYKIIYKNKGTTTQSGTVFFDFSENSGQMEFVSSNPVNDTLENDMLTWFYSNLQPFETREILVTLHMNTPMDTHPLNAGDDIGYVADIHPYLEDETPGDNNFQIKLTVVNSLDPNDITCLQGETITPEKVGDYVHYLIRFENTGTADAINIIVKDEIDLSKFDISTLIPLNGSHDFFTRIRDNNILEFIFEEINLPFDDANNDGYVLSKIKTLETLELGDVFTTEANIYFDYNFPILTNTAATEVAESLSVADNDKGVIKVYPNPTKDVLKIWTTNSLINKILVTDINERIVLNYMGGSDSSLELDFSLLSKGMYFVNIQTDSGSNTVKVVKQ